MTDSHENGQDRDEADIERVLAAGLRTAAFSEAAMLRLREAAAREWRATRSETRARRPKRWLWAAAAALVCIVIGATTGYLRPIVHPELFGVIARAQSGGGEIIGGRARHATLKAGVSVSSGDELTTYGPVLITLGSGGTLRIAPDTQLRLDAARQATLRRGRLYLDFPTASGAFDVSTRAGIIEHVGTEFEVFSDDQVVRIRVREGSVRLQSGAKQTLLEAGRQLTAHRDGSLTQSAIEPYGRDWLWVAALAPDYEIEGRPLVDFLQWAARELGRAVRYSDVHARDVAERTMLHGSVKGHDPLDALRTVLSTTSLTYEVRGDTIWLQSGQGT